MITKEKEFEKSVSQEEELLEYKNMKKIKKTTTKMKNITINIPYNYERNIQKLIEMKLIPNRSEAVRTAIREFLQREYNSNLKILDFTKSGNLEELTSSARNLKSTKKK